MFETISRTWELTKQSFAVLRADKEILLFPVMSTLAAVAVSATFLLPLYSTGALAGLAEGRNEPGTYLVLLGFYFVNYFVIIFFNCALVAAANIRLSGGDPTVADGLRIAWSRLGAIAAWALLASTVGLLLNMLEERFEKVGKIVMALLGMTWTLITFFMVPVIVFEDRGLTDAVKRSAELFRRNWGTQVTGGFSFGLIGFLLAIPGIVLGFAAMNLHPAFGIGILVVYLLLLSVIMAAVKGVFLAALYRYANNGTVVKAFASSSFESAFAPRGSRW